MIADAECLHLLAEILTNLQLGNFVIKVQLLLIFMIVILTMKLMLDDIDPSK